MAEKNSTLVFKLSLFAALLIFINGLLIAAQGSPLLYFSSVTDDPEAALAPQAASWWRISLGIPSLINGELILIWLTFSIINLLVALLLYVKPTKHAWWSWMIILCSLLSIPIGGGFIIGMVIGLIGGAIGVEWPKSPGSTFVAKLLRAARLDGTLYEKIGNEDHPLKLAAITIIFVNTLSGLGYGLYKYNLDKIIQLSSPSVPFRILFLGDISWDYSAVISPMINLIGISLLKWLILSTLIFLVGTKLLGRKNEFDKTGRIVSLAYVPVCLQVFLPVIMGSVAFIKVEWPLAVFFFTNIWMTLALLIGVMQLFKINIRQALGVVILAGTFYWLINYLFIIPTLEVPGIRLTVEPSSLILTLISASTVLAILLGVFTKR